MLFSFVFNSVISDLYRGHFDKLVLDCAFKQNLLTDRKSIFGMAGSCEMFRPMLTMQGFCHTFNGITLKKVWQSNDMMNAFQDTFRTDHLGEYFQGAGQAEVCSGPIKINNVGAVPLCKNWICLTGRI